MTSTAHIGRNRQVDAAENGRRDHAKRPDCDQCLLEVVELSVLARSTETVSDTANRMDQRISLLVVHLTAQASDIEVNDICRWIEMKIPDVLQQHPPRHDAVFVAHQIFQKLEFLGPKENLLAAPAGRPRDQVDCEIADAQGGVPVSDDKMIEWFKRAHPDEARQIEEATA
jgi:hypothetical protein